MYHSIRNITTYKLRSQHFDTQGEKIAYAIHEVVTIHKLHSYFHDPRNKYAGRPQRQLGRIMKITKHKLQTRTRHKHKHNGHINIHLDRPLSQVIQFS
jgi:hypothetical protein